jgi:hypothetical protein
MLVMLIGVFSIQMFIAFTTASLKLDKLIGQLNSEFFNFCLWLYRDNWCLFSSSDLGSKMSIKADPRQVAERDCACLRTTLARTSCALVWKMGGGLEFCRIWIVCFQPVNPS